MVIHHYELQIPVGRVRLGASLSIADGAGGIVVFSHGSGSSRFSSRNRYVASVLQKSGFSTLLCDLLTEEEDKDFTRRFNIPLLTSRLTAVREWLKKQPELSSAPVGYFGASTGAASAISAAADPGAEIGAIVTRGGRPDLALPALPSVAAPTLLLVGSMDPEVIVLNKNAYDMLTCEKKLIIIEGATHLFEEPGKLEEVAAHASEWFSKHLSPVLAHTEH
ncbi:MAG TPA: dienelactone hydrolase family protein [Chryseosolibacter sp.]|jgi:dienelactone hydrolase|nr:dienelactone hydrolase family protein [Chryseosolibacter sp.]